MDSQDPHDVNDDLVDSDDDLVDDLLDSDDDLVDINEAKRVVGLDKSTIYKLSREGRLRSYRVLSALRFRRADLRALVKPR